MTNIKWNFNFTRDQKEEANEYIYSIHIQTDEMKLRIITFYEKSDYYSVGLQKNYKNLVDMDKISYNLCYLLNVYNDMGKFNKENFDLVLSSYNAFIKSKKDYNYIESIFRGKVTGQEYR